MPEPDIDGDLSLFGCVTPFGVEYFATECSVEALIITVLPRWSWVDLHRLDADASEPVLQRCRDELRAIV